MKNKAKVLNVFCSISRGRLDEVNNLLIPSLEKQTTDYVINLYLINYTGDSTIKKSDVNRSDLNYYILNPDKPLGFGEAHNYAFQVTKPKDFFIIINPDVYLDNNCIKELILSAKKEVGLVEARQLPFSHPKDLPHKETFETNWASGCCLLINSEFFESVGGFDPNYWMYLEDVDLSWKAWINGYKVLQNPKAVVNHYTGLYFRYNENSYEIEDFWSMRNFLYISYTYFGLKGLKKAKRMILRTQYPKEFINKAVHNFEKFIERSTLQRITIPLDFRDKIKIFGYNKFSKDPK